MKMVIKENVTPVTEKGKRHRLLDRNLKSFKAKQKEKR